MLSQSWRAVGEGSQQSIQLDVILSVGTDQTTPVHLIITLDPATHLPRSCRVVTDDAQVTDLVQFRYPGAAADNTAAGNTVASRNSSSGTSPSDVATADSSNGEVRVAAADLADSISPETAVSDSVDPDSSETNAALASRLQPETGDQDLTPSL